MGSPREHLNQLEGFPLTRQENQSEEMHVLIQLIHVFPAHGLEDHKDRVPGKLIESLLQVKMEQDDRLLPFVSRHGVRNLHHQKIFVNT